MADQSMSDSYHIQVQEVEHMPGDVDDSGVGRTQSQVGNRAEVAN